MTAIVYDTNVLARQSLERVPQGLLLSAVVIQEITAGAADGGLVRRYNMLRRRYEAAGRLLVPNGEDWWMAGKVLNSLYRGLRSRRDARPAAIPREEQQRLLRDVLIARTAKRVGAMVVTENVADFMKIRRFCDVKVMPAANFF